MTLRYGKYKWLVAACMAVTALPAAAHERNQTAMDACIQAFVAEELPQGRKIEIVKRDTSSSVLSSGEGPRTVLVSAKGKRSGRSYGSARCVVKNDGEILAMYVRAERSQLAEAAKRDREASGG